MNTSRFLSRPLVLIAIAALALAAVQIAGGATKATSFSDAGGDNGTAPDITVVQVSDDASGQITFQIQTPATQALAADQRVILLIDSDQNGATGNNGIDYFFAVDSSGYDFARWNGGDWDSTTPYTTVHVRYATGALFSVNRSELGGTTGLDFRLRTLQGDSSDLGHFDDAPEAGMWSYTLAGGPPPAPTPTTTAPAPTTPTPTTSAPNRPAPPPTIGSLVIPASSLFPKAGRSFRFVVSSLRLDSNAIVAPSSVSCTAALGGVRLLGSGNGGCSWLLAKSARGKRLVVTVKVAYKTAATTQKYPMQVT